MIIVKCCNTKVLFSSPDIDSIQVQDGYDVPVYLRLNWKICNKNKILLVIGIRGNVCVFLWICSEKRIIGIITPLHFDIIDVNTKLNQSML